MGVLGEYIAKLDIYVQSFSLFHFPTCVISSSTAPLKAKAWNLELLGFDERRLEMAWENARLFFSLGVGAMFKQSVKGYLV